MGVAIWNYVQKSQKSQNVQKGLKNEVGEVDEAKSPYVGAKPEILPTHTVLSAKTAFRQNSSIFNHYLSSFYCCSFLYYTLKFYLRPLRVL